MLPSSLPALFPERHCIYGAATRRRLIYSTTIYGLIAAAGFALTQMTTVDAWRILGQGLMFPGGGFLFSFKWHCLLSLGIALTFFAASLLLWFATGNALAPPLSWLILAVLAIVLRQKPVPDSAGWIVLAIVSFIALAIWLVLLWQRFGGARWRRSANRELAGYLAATPSMQTRPDKSADEFSERELHTLHFLLDRALQPVEEFAGFEWLDQFQTASVRYQLHFTGYALAMAQATRLPALHGYLDEAQRRLIEKQRNHRIWRYWALENAWGHLARNPDPVARENIMFSGFCATQIAMFQASSGCRDYVAPESFALEHPDGRRFAYDYPTLIDALEHQFQKSRFGLLACEPNWIYPLCNAITLSAIKAADAHLGGTRWATLEDRIRQALEEEFIDPFGRFVPCRSTYTGLALPIIGGAMPQAMPCYFLNATMPDIAARQWLMLRRRLLDGKSHSPSLRRHAFWPIDTGNYRFSRAAALAGSALAAREMGDEEIADLCRKALDSDHPQIADQGRHYRPQASIWAHAVEMLAIAGKVNAFRDLINAPHCPNNGPSICDIDYPQVLVAKAVSDVESLLATLYPGCGPGRQRIGLTNLHPAGLYRSDGCEEKQIRASSEGKAEVHVFLDGRKEIRLSPIN